MTVKMIYLVTLIWILTVIQMISTITVSPDLGLRNLTYPNGKIDSLLSSKTDTSGINELSFSNKTANKLKANIPADRNRRLIPYMTFYIPTNDYSMNQQYDANSHYGQNNNEKNQSPVKNSILAIYQQPTTPPLNHNQQYHQESLMDPNRLPPQHLSHQYHHNNIPPYLRLSIHNNNNGNGNRHHSHQYLMQPIASIGTEGNYHTVLGPNKVLLNQYKINNNEYGGIPAGNSGPINHSQNGHMKNQYYHSHHGNENNEGHLLIKENNLHKSKQQYHELNKQPLVLIGNNNPVETYRTQYPKEQMTYSIFKESNKIPGHFTPIIINTNNQIGNNQNENNNLIHNNKHSDVENKLNEGEHDKQHNENNVKQLHEHNFNIIHNQYSEQVQSNLEQEKPNEQEHYYQYQEINSNPQEQHDIKNSNNKEHENSKIISSSDGVQQLQSNQNHIGNLQNVIVSSTQRPQYHSISNHQQQHRLHSKLSPQERYVAYLQEQFKQNQHGHHEHYIPQDMETDQNEQQINQQDSQNYNQDIYLTHPSPSPVPENHINYDDNSQKQVQNIDHHPHYIYTPDVTSQPKKVVTEEKDLILIQPQQELLRPHILLQSHQQNYERVQSTDKPNRPLQNHENSYAQYIDGEQENKKNIYHRPPAPSAQPNIIPARFQHDNPTTSGYKSVVFVTTPQPILVTSIGSVYKNQPVQHLRPISTPQPSHHTTSQEQTHQKIHLISSTPPPSQIFLIKPSTDIPIKHIHQHLTETTSPRPRPIRPLSRYHSRYHKFYPSSTPSTISTPLKLTPSQKYEPIHVTQAIPIRTTLGTTTTMAPPSLPTRYSKNYPQLKHHPHTLSTDTQPQISENYRKPSYPDIRSNSLAEILRKLQESNHLPQTITADNIDNSIKTLIKILNNLKESQTIVENPSQYHEPPETGNTNSNDDDYSDTPVDTPNPSHAGPNSGRPGIDYPALAEIPPTKFSCREQRYKGFFGDPETNCQVWHYCDLNGGQASFLCPNGTIFSQVALTCDWWFNVKCSNTAQLYVLNERLYKYILPFTPKFPEDYSGPLVDKYLALKFKEMEEKMTREKLKGREEEIENNDGDENKITESENNSTKEETENSTERETQNESENEENENSNLDNEEVKSVNLEDVENNRGSVDTGLPYNKEYVKQKLRPIIVSTTLVPSSITSTPSPSSPASQSSESSDENSSEHYFSSTSSTTRQPLQQRHNLPRNLQTVEVESEKVEVIEIKTDGSTGHLIPPHGSEY